MAPTGIGNIEKGKALPTVATCEQLAAALNVSSCWLAYSQGEGPQADQAVL